MFQFSLEATENFIRILHSRELEEACILALEQILALGYWVEDLELIVYQKLHIEPNIIILFITFLLLK